MGCADIISFSGEKLFLTLYVFLKGNELVTFPHPWKADVLLEEVILLSELKFPAWSCSSFLFILIHAALCFCECRIRVYYAVLHGLGSWVKSRFFLSSFFFLSTTSEKNTHLLSIDYFFLIHFFLSFSFNITCTVLIIYFCYSKAALCGMLH